jgi:hypothetical protein
MGASCDAIEFSKQLGPVAEVGRGKSIFLWTYRTDSRGYLYRGTHPTCTRPEGNEQNLRGIFGAAVANQLLNHCHPRATAEPELKGYGPARLSFVARNNLCLQVVSVD